MDLQDSIAVSDAVVAREVGGETVLLHLDQGTYYGLNEVGGHIWRFLEDGKHTVAEIRDMLVKEYNIAAAEAESDVLALTQDLVGHGLLERSSA